jgi:hypothetical protein
MNIEELLKDLVITEARKNQICNDNNLKNYIDNKVFTSVFNTMVESLKQFPVVRRKFIYSYSEQPESCCETNILLFSPLGPSGRASNTKWIARMPLRKNGNSGLIYFPQSIIIKNDDNFRLENIRLNNPNYHYAVLINVKGFIDAPEKFISIDKIEERI